MLFPKKVTKRTENTRKMVSIRALLVTKTELLALIITVEILCDVI